MVKPSTIRHLLPLLLIAAAIPIVHCLGEKKVLQLHKLQWDEKRTSLIPSNHPSRNVKSATILEMKHQYDKPELIKNPGDDNHHQILISDEARVSSLQSRIKEATSNARIRDNTQKAQIPLTSGVKVQTLNYVVTIGIGGKKTTVIVDTGSDLTWVQCKPCLNCYDQQDPFFDPSASPSYQIVPCNSTSCNSLQSATGNPTNCGLDQINCYYDLGYGDGSYTRGVLAREKITLGGTAVKNFIFGCGRNNHGLFGEASGIMGLGRTPLSLISQTSAQFKGIFSYCLPARVFNSSGSLVFGDNPALYKNSTPISYTNMISDFRRPNFYFLNLTGISVGGVAIQSPSNKILIDSGTVITRLAPSVYNATRAEFMKQFSGYPMAPSFSILDTCFNLSSYDEVFIPRVSLGFDGGVMMNVDVAGVLYFVKKDASQVCLAVTSLSYDDEVAIMGNFQQKNQRVVYDTVGSRLGFAEEVCGHSQ